MGHDIFISYRRSDSAFFAGKLRDRLEQTFSGQVFLDVSGIPAGQDFVEILRTAVATAKVVIAVIGPEWATSSDGSSRLGDPNDFVTEEIGTALEADIPIIPVLIEATPMPALDQLPARLRPLHRRNAIRVSHARFESDVNDVVDALYTPMGEKAPSKLERMLETLPFGYRISERSRRWASVLSLGAGLLGVMLLVPVFLGERIGASELIDLSLAAGLGVVMGILGLNSARAGRLAVGGLITSGLTLVGVLIVGFSRLSPTSPTYWLDVLALAEDYRNAKELPAGELHWTSESPVPWVIPSVDCPCLEHIAELEKRPSLAAEGRVTFRNHCGYQVVFVVSRSETPFAPGWHEWVTLPGREFATVALAPSQTIQIPLQGYLDSKYLPWQCR